MRFGIFDHIEGIAGTGMHQLLRDRIELVKLVDAAGFVGYHLAEHHGTDLCLAPNQEIFLAAAAEATTQIRLGPMVKLLPLHHPLRVLEDICVLDQLTGGRVDYGVGRGIAAIEHFWFEADWFSAHDRFEDALALILQGLRTGKVDSSSAKYYDFPPIALSMSPYQSPNPPMWYPGNPVMAGKFGMNLMWPGPIPREARDLYVQTWNEFAGASVRADRPGDEPRVGVVELIAVSHDEAEAKDIAARGWKGLMRRVVETHILDRLALDEAQAEAALNPLARGAFALMEPGGDAMLPELTVSSGTPAHVRSMLERYAADGCDYLVLQLPTGDMTFDEAKRSIQLFIDEVMPHFR
jgi:alkanesulfonate monooxygenase SsuD/methylene tetrahydromethanopterin reductase-like flavin-dependent oxidoreductase (luciferase family)